MPPTNTSAIDDRQSTAKPHTRRSVLSAIAAATAAVTVAGARPTDAAFAVDPIYAAIEKHKAGVAAWDAVMIVRARYHEADDNETQRLQDAADEAWGPCEDAAFNLLNTAPTTLAGIVTAIRYIIVQLSDDGTFMPHHIEYDNGGDAQDTMGWIDAWLDTLADATAALAKGSEANA